MFALRVIEIPYFPLKESVGGLAQVPTAPVQCTHRRCQNLVQKYSWLMGKGMSYFLHESSNYRMSEIFFRLFRIWWFCSVNFSFLLGMSFIALASAHHNDNLMQQ